MGNGLHGRSRLSLMRTSVTFVLHQLASTWGVIAIASTLAALPFDIYYWISRAPSAHYYHWILTETPYFPVQIAVGLSLGWLLGYKLRHQSMLWMWILPGAILGYAVVAIPTLFPALTSQVAQPSQTPLSHYFGWGCRPENHCIDQLAITLPFYCSVAYSIGALMSQKMTKPSRGAARQRFFVAFIVGLTMLVAIVVDLAVQHMRGWSWLDLPFILVAAGIGIFLIRFALRMKQEATEAT
jgi:hypothetical protein